MARDRGSVCKICRREGLKLFLKGERCLSPQCAFDRRSYKPGIHGRDRQFRRKVSEYGVQLREKQKVRGIYGVLERQFVRYFKDAARRKGVTGVSLLQTLEMRLDNVVYRLGFADSRNQARQLVGHGHFEVNGRKLDVPSAILKAGDEVAVRDGSKGSSYFKELPKVMEGKAIPRWASVDANNLSGRVLELPSREDIADIPINEQLIVEYYSR